MVTLNKPFKSDVKGKKYSVYVKFNNKKGYKKINFGATGYDDWRSGTATKEQRKSYLARAKIKQLLIIGRYRICGD